MVVITFQKGAKVAQVGGQKVPNPLGIASNSPAKVRMEVIFWAFATKSCIIQPSDLSAGIYHCPLAPRRPSANPGGWGGRDLQCNPSGAVLKKFSARPATVEPPDSTFSYMPAPLINFFRGGGAAVENCARAPKSLVESAWGRAVARQITDFQALATFASAARVRVEKVKTKLKK